MFQLQGKIRDYASASDTASVELEALGLMDAWLDNISVDPAVNRAFLVHGSIVTLQVADAHRLCEAVVVGVGSNVTSVTQQNVSGVATTQTGHGFFVTNGSGFGSAGINFSPAFVAIPTISCAINDAATCSMSAVTNAGFTISTPAGGGAPANANVYYSWQATGH